MPLAIEGRGGTLLLMALAAVTLFVASRCAAGALARTSGRPGLRAVGHWLPIAITCVVALHLRRPEIAVALAFSTSVAALSFVLGVLSYVAPMEGPPSSRRAGPFVLPAALLAAGAGVPGLVTPVDALVVLASCGAGFLDP